MSNMAKTNSTSKEEEAQQLLTDKVANMPLNISDRLYAITDDIENSLKNKVEKINKLIKAIDSMFPPSTPSRGLFEGFSAMSYDTAYSLYLLNNNSALIIELHGILERFCLNALTDILPINDIAKDVIHDSFDKKTLKDIAPYFEKFNMWGKDDVEFALELTKLRNGIAHKNAELVSRSKLVKSNGQARHPESIHTMMSKVDCSDYIVQTMDLIIKASGIASPSFIKQPRLHARYSIYIPLIGELYNLFLTNPYSQNNSALLETYINDRLAKAYIVGSEKLVSLLQEYRRDVLRFHRSLMEGDDEKSRIIHSGFGEILHSILLAMREDLQVDNGKMEILEEPNHIDVKPYIEKNNRNKAIRK